MNLQNFQRAFLKQITQLDDGRGDLDPQIEVLDHDVRMTPRERLGIYVQDYRGRLFEVLKENYPQTFAYLGEDDFLALFEAYVSASPPSSYSLRYWGETLVSFCKSESVFNQPELVDLLRFEWFIHDLYDGADADVLTAASLSEIDQLHWMDLRLQLIPCLKLWQAETNVVALWQSLKNEEPVSISFKDCLLVHWRKDFDVYFRELDPGEWDCLAALGRGDSVGDLVERLGQSLGNETAPPVLAQYLHSWIDDGMVQAIAA